MSRRFISLTLLLLAALLAHQPQPAQAFWVGSCLRSETHPISGAPCPPTVTWLGQSNYESINGCDNGVCFQPLPGGIVEDNLWNEGGSWFSPSSGAHWGTLPNGGLIQYNNWYLNEDGWYARLIHNDYRCQKRVRFGAKITILKQVVDVENNFGPEGYTIHDSDVGAGLMINVRNGEQFLACRLDVREQGSVQLVAIDGDNVRILASQPYSAKLNHRYYMTLEYDGDRYDGYNWWSVWAAAGWGRVRCGVEGAFVNRWGRQYNTFTSMTTWIRNGPAGSLYQEDFSSSGSIGIFTEFASAKFEELEIDSANVIDEMNCCKTTPNHLGGVEFEIKTGPDGVPRCRSRQKLLCENLGTDNYAFNEATEECIANDIRCPDPCPIEGDCELGNSFIRTTNLVKGKMRQRRYSESDCYWMAQDLGGAGYSFRKLRYRAVGICHVFAAAAPDRVRAHYRYKTVIFRENVNLDFITPAYADQLPQCNIIPQLPTDPFEICLCDCDLTRECDDQGMVFQHWDDDECTPRHGGPYGTVTLEHDLRCLCCLPELWNAPVVDDQKHDCAEARGVWVDESTLLVPIDFAVKQVMGRHDDVQLISNTLTTIIAELSDTLDAVCVPCTGFDCVEDAYHCQQQGGSWYPPRCYPYERGSLGFGVTDATSCEAIGKIFVPGQCYSEYGDIDCEKEVCTIDSKPVTCSGVGQEWQPGYCTGPHATIPEQTECAGTTFEDYVRYKKNCIMASEMWQDGPAWVKEKCSQVASTRRRLLAAEDISLKHSRWLQRFVAPGYHEHVDVLDWVQPGFLDQPLEGRDSSLGHGGLPVSELDNYRDEMFRNLEKHRAQLKTELSKETLGESSLDRRRRISNKDGNPGSSAVVAGLERPYHKPDIQDSPNTTRSSRRGSRRRSDITVTIDGARVKAHHLEKAGANHAKDMDARGHFLF